MKYCRERIYSKRVKPMVYDAYGLIHTMHRMDLEKQIDIHYKFLPMLKSAYRCMSILKISDLRYTSVKELYEVGCKRLDILKSFTNA